MKIYFGACGIGLGHVGRCLQIADKLNEQGHKIFFSTYLDGVNLVKKSGYPYSVSPPVIMVEHPDGTVDTPLTTTKVIYNVLSALKQLMHEIREMIKFKPDVVVSDTRLTTLIAAKILRIPRILITNQLKVIIPRWAPPSSIKDALLGLVEGTVFRIFVLFWHMGNPILLVDFPPPLTISKKNIVIPPALRKRSFYLGVPTRVKPEDLPPIPEIRKKYGLDDKPLIFITISGTKHEKEGILKKIEKILPKIGGDFTIVLSRGIPNGSTKPHVFKNIHIYDWVENRYELIKACDIVVSRSGQTTVAQGMYFGKKMILIPVKNHTEQMGNAESAEDMGFARVLPQDDVSAENLRKLIEDVLNSESMAKRAVEISKKVKKYGNVDVFIDEIIKKAQ